MSFQMRTTLVMDHMMAMDTARIAISGFNRMNGSSLWYWPHLLTHAFYASSSDLDPTKMKKVAGLLSDLFTSSFRLAVPSLFRGMIQKLVVFELHALCSDEGR